MCLTEMGVLKRLQFRRVTYFCSPLNFTTGVMKKIVCCLIIFLQVGLLVCAQTTKSTEQVEQLWFGYFNQSRFSKKWGMWTDLHLRTKEDFVNNFSQSIVRLGLTYYVTDATKL